MSCSFDAVVVGAGIVGSACARELAANGLRVAVCDVQGFSGGGATGAGMGHIAVMDDSDAQFALTAYSQRLWNELAPHLPASAEISRCGSLWIAADEEELTEVRRKFEYYSQRDLPVEMLDGKQLSEAEPNLRQGLAGALLMPADSVCYPPCVSSFLLAQVLEAKGEFLKGSAVTSVREGAVELASGDQIHAGLVVVAAGTASRRLLPDIEVRPRKGHLLITDRYPDFIHHQLIELGYLKSAHSLASDSVAFNAQPRSTGQILLGSSRQFGGEDRSIDYGLVQRMGERALQYLPALSELQFTRIWTGFRAETPDKLPLIGPVHGFERVYLATGHEGLGISTSLATAKLIADHIFERPLAIELEPYLPSRTFAVHV